MKKAAIWPLFYYGVLMDLKQLKIKQLHNIPNDNKLKLLLNKNKIKFNISSSGKSITIEEQSIMSMGHQVVSSIVFAIMELVDWLSLTVEGSSFVLKPIIYTKLLVDHDIELDNFTDFDDNDLEEFSDMLDELHIHHSIHNQIFRIHAQKCQMEFEHINNIIHMINCGSKAESYIYSYEDNKYGISQRTGYQRFLK